MPLHWSSWVLRIWDSYCPLHRYWEITHWLKNQEGQAGSQAILSGSITLATGERQGGAPLVESCFPHRARQNSGLFDFCQWASTVRPLCHLFCLLHLHSLSLPTRHLPVNPRWKPWWQLGMASHIWHPNTGIQEKPGLHSKSCLKKNQNNNKIPNKDKNKP